MRTPLGGNYRNSYQERHLRGIKIWSNYNRANDQAALWLQLCTAVENWRNCYRQRNVHDLPLYLICPDVLSLVGELLSGYGCGSSNRMKSSLLSYLFMYLYLRFKVYFCLFNQLKNHILTKKKQQPSTRSRTNGLWFSVTTLYTTSLAPLSY